MASSVTTTVKHWEEPEKRTVSGEPPGPGVTVSHTSRGETRRQDIRAVHPLYKNSPYNQVPNAHGVSVHLKSESRIDPPDLNGAPDYKVETERDTYDLKIIDPKVDRQRQPIKYRTLQPKHRATPDFPSCHSKRSFLKLDALEPRRVKTRPPLIDVTSIKVNRTQSAQPPRWQFSPKPPPPSLPVRRERSSSPPKPKPVACKKEINFQHEERFQSQTLPRPPPLPPQNIWAVPTIFVPITYEVTEDYKFERHLKRQPADSSFSDSRSSTVVRLKDENSRRPKPTRTGTSTKKHHIVREFEQSETFKGGSSLGERSTQSLERPVPKYDLSKLIETTDKNEETKRTEEVHRIFRSGGRKKHEKVEHRPAQYDLDYGRISRGTTSDKDRNIRGGRKIIDRNGFSQEHVTREFFGNDDNYYARSLSSGGRPYVEFPPSLPRQGVSLRGVANFDDQLYNTSSGSNRDLALSEGVRRRWPKMGMMGRSSDWTLHPELYDESVFFSRDLADASNLEREFRDASLAPLPFGQNLESKEHREERLPKGHESLTKEVKASSGTKGRGTFSETKQEIHFEKEEIINGDR